MVFQNTVISTDGGDLELGEVRKAERGVDAHVEEVQESNTQV
jgi:hypothetical protein